jgi:hypothetical protein
MIILAQVIPSDLDDQDQEPRNTRCFFGRKGQDGRHWTNYGRLEFGP